MPGTGSRIIIKSRFLNPSKNEKGGTGTYAQYIGTREGAVRIAEDEKNNPASKEQIRMVEELIHKNPTAAESLAYTEFKNDMTIGTADRFITEAIKKYGSGPNENGIDRYAAYMATRPGVVKVHTNGLFSDTSNEIKMRDLKKTLKEYKGNVYLPIISLRPEDSVGLGYDNPEAWQKLLHRHRDDIAKAFSIKPENLNWVAAYHHAVNNDGYEHNHVHMMVWSTNPSEGWQTPETCNDLKRVLANDIFAEENKMIHANLDRTRDELRTDARDLIDEISKSIADGSAGMMTDKDQKFIADEMLMLSDAVKNIQGRKAYKSMPKNIKQMVDNITDDLFKRNPDLQKTLNAWADIKNQQIRIYRDGGYELPPVSQIEDFKPIKNKILREAFSLSRLSGINASVSANISNGIEAADSISNMSEENSTDNQAHALPEDFFSKNKTNAKQAKRNKSQSNKNRAKANMNANSPAMKQAAYTSVNRVSKDSVSKLINNIAGMSRAIGGKGKHTLRITVGETEEEKKAKNALGIR